MKQLKEFEDTEVFFESVNKRHKMAMRVLWYIAITFWVAMLGVILYYS
jgi:hypothetical protein